MNNKVVSALSYLLVIIITTNCTGGPVKMVELTPQVPQTSEVTRVVLQTVEVTKLVPQTGDSQGVNLQITPIPIGGEGCADEKDYKGIVTITRYYTFLGSGLYKEAYDLLGPKARDPYKGESDFIQSAKRNFIAVKIITIQPFYPHSPFATPVNKDVTRIFFVQIIAEGVENMSGSVANGEVQDLFLTLMLHGSEWKIDSFATGL